MPIYEYTCRSCGENFDQLRNVNDLDSDVECPKCQKKNASRKMSLTAAARELLQQLTASSSCSGRRYG
jgi:putative FmdB family regulatory protein